MTLFFSLEKLEKSCKQSDVLFMKILKQYFEVKCKNKPKYQGYKSLTGRSYLLNPEPLFNQTIDIAYVVQYIRLAAHRDYTHYVLYSDPSLDTSFFPDLDFTNAQRNPLLSFNHKHINFKFEDIYHGAKFR